MTEETVVDIDSINIDKIVDECMKNLNDSIKFINGKIIQRFTSTYDNSTDNHSVSVKMINVKDITSFEVQYYLSDLQIGKYCFYIRFYAQGSKTSECYEPKGFYVNKSRFNSGTARIVADKILDNITIQLFQQTTIESDFQMKILGHIESMEDKLQAIVYAPESSLFKEIQQERQKMK